MSIFFPKLKLMDSNVTCNLRVLSASSTGGGSA